MTISRDEELSDLNFVTKWSSLFKHHAYKPVLHMEAYLHL